MKVECGFDNKALKMRFLSLSIVDSGIKDLDKIIEEKTADLPHFVDGFTTTSTDETTNEKNYTITIQLKDKDDNVVSVKTIDLPIEITSDNISIAVRESLADPKEETKWSQEEQQQACKTIGALSLESEIETWLAGQVTLYGTVRDSQGYPSYARQYVTNNPVAGRVPRWSGRTTLLTNEPQEDLDCANKKYVDDLFATSGGITEDDLNTAISTAKEDIYKNVYTKTEVYNQTETNNTFETKEDATKKLTDAKAYTDAEIEKLNLSGGGSGGSVTVESATNEEIEAQESTTTVITPFNLSSAVIEALVNNKRILTNEEKLEIYEWLGITNSSSDKLMIYETTTNSTGSFTPINNTEIIVVEKGYLVWDSSTINVLFEIAFYDRDSSSIQTQTIEIPPLNKKNLNETYSQVFLLGGNILIFELLNVIEGNSETPSGFSVTIKEYDDVGNISFIVKNIYVKT